MKPTDTVLTLLLPAECQWKYTDYYKTLDQFLQTRKDYCAFDDTAHQKVNFTDTWMSKAKWAIDTLMDYCVIKWRGDRLDSFDPGDRVSRAEFMKMLAKILAIQEKIEFMKEWSDRSGELDYLDVKKTYRASQYIAYLDQKGLLDPLKWTLISNNFFFPKKSLTVPEIAEILSLAPGGQEMTTLDIIGMLGKNMKYATREQVAELLVRKYLDTFHERLYLQWKNRIYFEELKKKLRGKKQPEQYDIIIDQMQKLDTDSLWLSLWSSSGGKLYPYRIKRYLEQIVK